MDGRVKETPKIQLTAYTLGLAGAALFTILLIHQGASDVVRALAAVGPWLSGDRRFSSPANVPGRINLADFVSAGRSCAIPNHLLDAQVGRVGQQPAPCRAGGGVIWCEPDWLY